MIWDQFDRLPTLQGIIVECVEDLEPKRGGVGGVPVWKYVSEALGSIHGAVNQVSTSDRLAHVLRPYLHAKRFRDQAY